MVVEHNFDARTFTHYNRNLVGQIINAITLIFIHTRIVHTLPVLSHIISVHERVREHESIFETHLNLLKFVRAKFESTSTV